MIISEVMLNLSPEYLSKSRTKQDLTNLIFTPNDLKISTNFQNLETVMCCIHVHNGANHKDCKLNSTELSIKYLSIW